MNFGVIGWRKSAYTGEMLQNLLQNGLRPQYVLVEDSCENNLALSAFLLDNRLENRPGDEGWRLDAGGADDVLTLCRQNGLCFYCVDNQNGAMAQRVLAALPLDVLLITEGPIFRGHILELPRLCMLNVHAAPLPQFRGNWTTLLSLYNDYPPVVSAHAVVSAVDAGSILDTLRYDVYEGDGVEDINRRAWAACRRLAVKVLADIRDKGFAPARQRAWEGRTYAGRRDAEGRLQPAMPRELQLELERRLSIGRYGFYSPKPEKEEAV